MSFGTRLRELREERNITQRALADVLGVSPRMVSFYESGAHFPRDENQLIRLAAFFQTSTDYLLGYSNIRSVSLLHRLGPAFEALPESDQQAVLDFADFLSTKQKKDAR